MEELFDELVKICGDSYVVLFNDTIKEYGQDNTMNFMYKFDVLVMPGNAAEISEILKLGNKYQVPIIPRGGGSGVTGGALPITGGIILSLERLNRIIELNKCEHYIVAESGVIASDLCAFVEADDLYFPVSPTSAQISFIGGNVAQNAGSMKSCKYGSTSNYVLNLEVVLANGDIIWTGANVAKNSTGLNLTQLFVGSQGILGVITKVVFRLLPKPKHQTLLLAGFKSLNDACKVVMALKECRLVPASVEIICENAIRLTKPFLNESYPLLSDNIEAHLLVLVEEHSHFNANCAIEEINKVLQYYTCDEIYVASSQSEIEYLWKLRLHIGKALTSSNRYYRDVDVCIPVSRLLDYITQVESICHQSNIVMYCFGHALDGNLHTMISIDNDTYSNVINTVLNKIYSYAISKGGVISGEHGIGFLQREFTGIQYSDTHLKLLQSVKYLFDPKSILNPFKIL